MEAQFWLGRWKDKQTGWHQSHTNYLLEKYWPQLKLDEGSHVLVPCCGKSLDMLYLNEQGYKVTGLELSEEAARAFFEENSLSFEEKVLDHFKVLKAKERDLCLYVGDLFKLKKADIPTIDAIYDRAALIALNEEQRQRYAQVLCEVSGNNTKMLILSLEYNQNHYSPPPHAVLEDEIRRLYSVDFNIELFCRLDILEESEKFKRANVKKLDETCFYLSRK